MQSQFKRVLPNVSEKKKPLRIIVWKFFWHIISIFPEISYQPVILFLLQDFSGTFSKRQKNEWVKLFQKKFHKKH